MQLPCFYSLFLFKGKHHKVLFHYYKVYSLVDLLEEYGVRYFHLSLFPHAIVRCYPGGCSNIPKRYLKTATKGKMPGRWVLKLNYSVVKGGIRTLHSPKQDSVLQLKLVAKKM